MTRSRLAAALAGAAAALAVPAAPAAGSHGQLTVVEDEHQMLELGPVARARALDDAAALGTDVVRADVIWSRAAPAPASTRRPARFDAADPGAYPAGAFDALDGLVRDAQSRGLSVLLTPTGPGPAWASHCAGPVHARQVCRPDAREYGLFVRALGRRYSGATPGLPRVARWSIWNEPNQPGWLSPQYARVGGRLAPVAADLYRGYARAAIAALHATGHAHDQVLLGETSPIGRSGGAPARRPITPQAFISELLCLDGRGRPLTGAPARERGCARFARLAVTGFAHHPYTRGGSRPPLSPALPGEMTIGTGGRLARLLDRGARAGRIPRRLPIFYTENGWQTNPPDRIFGVPLARQAEYLNEADWIAYRDPRVRSVAQYKLVDDPDLGAFQSGLRFASGAAKPAFDAFRLPIWVARRGSQATVFGQVRPAPAGRVQAVEVQQARRRGTFATVRTLAVRSANGTFTVSVPLVRGGIYRLRWNGLVSREAVAR